MSVKNHFNFFQQIRGDGGPGDDHERDNKCSAPLPRCRRRRRSHRRRCRDDNDVKDGVNLARRDILLDSSTDRLANANANTDADANADANANIAPIKIARMSDASVDFLANAKANAADVPSSFFLSETSAERFSDAKADAFATLVACARTADASANCLGNAGLMPLSRPLSVHGRRGLPC